MVQRLKLGAALAVAVASIGYLIVAMGGKSRAETIEENLALKYQVMVAAKASVMSADESAVIGCAERYVAAVTEVMEYALQNQRSEYRRDDLVREVDDAVGITKTYMHRGARTDGKRLRLLELRDQMRGSPYARAPK